MHSGVSIPRSQKADVAPSMETARGSEVRWSLDEFGDISPLSIKSRACWMAGGEVNW